MVGQLPVALQGAVAVTLDGHIYVAGGQSAAGINGIIWGFEPPTAAMVVAGHLKAPVSGAGATAIGTTAWLVGGRSGAHPVPSVQTFKPMVGLAAPPVTGSSPRSSAASKSPPPAG
jgi:hypothetical protein